jgi:hypothetical protein
MSPGLYFIAQGRRRPVSTQKNFKKKEENPRSENVIGSQQVYGIAKK